MPQDFVGPSAPGVFPAVIAGSLCRRSGSFRSLRSCCRAVSRAITSKFASMHGAALHGRRRTRDFYLLAVAVHFDVHLDRTLILGQEPYHLGVVVEALHRMGQQALEPAWVLRLR